VVSARLLVNAFLAPERAAKRIAQVPCHTLFVRAQAQTKRVWLWLLSFFDMALAMSSIHIYCTFPNLQIHQPEITCLAYASCRYSPPTIRYGCSLPMLSGAEKDLLK